MEDRVANVLASIGFNKNEIKVYLDLLKYKNSSALEISKRTGIHRSNTYDAIRKLIAAGFVSETIEEKKRVFNSMEPEKIKYYLKQKENEVDEILPFLKNIPRPKNDPESISIEKGIFSVRESLYDLLKLNKTINVYGASQAAYTFVGEGFLKEYHKERIKKKILMRHIYDETAIDRVKYLNKLNFTEAKYFSKRYFTITATFICNDCTMIVVFSNPLTIIKIKNKEVSEAYNKYFDILWSRAKIP